MEADTMSRLIYLILCIIAVIAIFSMMFPLLIVVFGIGLVYTIIERYKASKAIKEEQKVFQDLFENTEERQTNLGVIEAEYEEKK